MSDLTSNYTSFSGREHSIRMAMARAIVKGTPNEAEWNEALDGAEKVRRDAYANARKSLENAFEDYSCK